MIAELDAEAETGDEVHHQDTVHLNFKSTANYVEHPHGAHELEEDKEHAEDNEHRNLNAREYL